MKEVEQFISANSSVQWLLVLILSIALSFLAKMVLIFVVRRIDAFSLKTKARWDDVLADGLSHTKTWVLWIWIFNPLSEVVGGSPGAHKAINVLTIIATAIQLMIWGLHAIRGFTNDYLRQRVVEDASSASAFNLISTAIKALFVIAVTLICLSNLGVDIGALIAGLGIGGVAVALAAQNILGDLFASLSIVLDKPFVVGDYIVAGNDQGTVENIGIKTTRVRSLSGEELIFANKDLLESRIKNFKRMRERRVVLGFRVPYTTPLEKVREVPGWVRSYIESEKLLRHERSHLSSLDNEALNFETIYWVEDPDYNKYMDLQQELLQKIIAKFGEEKINFKISSQIVSVAQLPELVFGEAGGALPAPSNGHGTQRTPEPPI